MLYHQMSLVVKKTLLRMELLFLLRPNTEVRDTDEESEFLNKNFLCHLNENLLLEENY